MAAFTTLSNKDHTALPAHFIPEQFIRAAIVNWDHEGKGSSEDATMTVLLQDKSSLGAITGKPNTSDTDTFHGSQKFDQNLNYQEMRYFNKPLHHPSLPLSFSVESSEYSSKASANKA